jgi:hypothetical protein
LSLEISPDTFFLSIIALFTGIVIPLARKYTKTICIRLTASEQRLDLLEFIAVHQHPDLVEKFKKYKDVKI